MSDVARSNTAAWATAYHAPAMAAEVLAHFAPLCGRDDAVAIDGTLGGGGHALALLEAGFRVYGVDRDPDALAAAAARLASHAAAGRFTAVAANYADLDTALPSVTADAVLLDLGISSHQIDDAARGFSFRAGAPLDMRMAGAGGADEDAAAVLNDWDERALAAVFRDYGDEPRAGRLAREVVRRRATRPFATADDLVGAVRGAFGPRTGPGDFARLFQAVRIAVNDELAGLDRALPALRDRLAPGGRIAVLSYHSGEDRRVKHAFRGWGAACTCPPRQPACTCGRVPLGAVVTRRAEAAAPDEIARNPRARSAKLRVWERAGAPAAAPGPA
jgi:16S rRNA (cytosine1402-N4)-methyltransferase